MIMMATTTQKTLGQCESGEVALVGEGRVLVEDQVGEDTVVRWLARHRFSPPCYLRGTTPCEPCEEDDRE